MRTTWLVLIGCLCLTGCAQSDEELCKDVRKKLEKCGTIGPSSCPEALQDPVREQYECIMDVECSELAECAI
jgi:hypothetical protein